MFFETFLYTLGRVKMSFYLWFLFLIVHTTNCAVLAPDFKPKMALLFVSSNREYYISLKPADLETARDTCEGTVRKKPLTLLSIEDEKEYTQILWRLKDVENVNGIWTSGYYIASNASYIWTSTHLSMKYSNFIDVVERRRRSIAAKKATSKATTCDCKAKLIAPPSDTIQIQAEPKSLSLSRGKRCGGYPFCEAEPCKPLEMLPCNTTREDCTVKFKPECTTIRPPCSVVCPECEVITPPCIIRGRNCRVEAADCTSQQLPCEVSTPPCVTTRPECRIEPSKCITTTPPPCTTISTTKPCTFPSCEQTTPPCIISQQCTTTQPPCNVTKNPCGMFKGEFLCPPDTVSCPAPIKLCKSVKTCPQPTTTCNPVPITCRPPVICQSPAIICKPPQTFCPPAVTVCLPPTVTCPPPVINCPEPTLVCEDGVPDCPAPIINCPSPIVTCPSPVTSCGQPDVDCPKPEVKCPDVIPDCPAPKRCEIPPLCPTSTTTESPVPTTRLTTKEPCPCAEKSVARPEPTSTSESGWIVLNVEYHFKWDIEHSAKKQYHFICEGDK